MKKILVTGANGFVGSHLVEVLLNKGYSVFAAYRKGSRCVGDSEANRVELDYANPQPVLAEVNPDIIIHVAGVTVASTEKAYRQGNVEITENLIEGAEIIELEKFVFVSSLAARGPGIDTVDSPVSDYGASKLEAEKVIVGSSLPYSIVRPTAVFGPKDRAFLPLFKWAQKGLILELGSSTRKLTFIHVKDLCNQIIDQISKNESRIIELSDGYNYIQSDLSTALSNVVNRRTILIRIPVWLFRFFTRMAHFFVWRIFKRNWQYTPEKVKELIADDWSIKGNSVGNSDHLIGPIGMTFKEDQILN